MTGFFISKKQKKLMKERRRKKKLAAKGELRPPPLTSVDDEDGDDRSPSWTSKKRPRSEENGNHNDQFVEEESLQTDAAASSSSHDPTVITVPAGLSSKEAKKFRKDARRKARAEGRDESKLQFVVEGEERCPQKKKPKRSFPCINEILRQERLEQQQRDKQKKEDELSDEYKARYVALDCEMVGIGSDGKKSALARVSMVDWWGRTVLDSFVKVPTKVTDFRTFVSGVKPKHLQSESALDVKECRETVSGLLKDKILVGHALKNDLQALMLQHPVHMIRDTAKHRPFQRLHNNKKWRPRKLRDLASEHCGLSIQQEGESHDSVKDARAAIELFKTVHEDWERELELKATKQKRKKGQR